MVEESEDGNELKIFDVYQLPNGKWEATVLGCIVDEPVDDINQAILWAIGSIANAFVRHINESIDGAHPDYDDGW